MQACGASPRRRTGREAARARRCPAQPPSRGVGASTCAWPRTRQAIAQALADALESQAAATPNEAQETTLNTQADKIEQQAGNADGGATTSNTPTTEAPAEKH